MLFLAQEAPYVISFKEVAWGMLLIALTITMHGCGMLVVLRVNDRMTTGLKRRYSLVRDLLALAMGALMIVLCHLLEVIPWAGFIFAVNAMPNTSIAYYLALLDYATLGSPYNLPHNWRLLEGMIAIAGLMTFAWSTGILIVMAQNFQDQHRKRRSMAAGRQGDIA